MTTRGTVIYGVDETGRPVKILVKPDGTVKVEGVITSITEPVTVEQTDPTKLKATVEQETLDKLKALTKSWPLNVQAIVNGSFEDDFLGWYSPDWTKVAIDETTAAYGKKSCKLSPGGRIYQEPIPPIPTHWQAGLYKLGRISNRREADIDSMTIYTEYTDGTTFEQPLDMPGTMLMWGSWPLGDYLSHEKWLTHLELRARDTNVKPIWIDAIKMSYFQTFDIFDKTTRELGKVTATIGTDLLLGDRLNHAVNGDFEKGLGVGWVTLKGSPSTAGYPKFGVNALFCPYGAGAYQPYPGIATDDIINLSCWVRRGVSPFPSGTLRVIVYYSDGSTTSTDYTPAAAYTYYFFSIPFVVGKYMIGISFENSSPTSPSYILVDGYICVSGLSAGFFKKTLGYKTKLTFYGEYTIAPAAERIYLNLSGTNIGKVERLVMWASHSDVVMWIGWDAFWHTIRDLDASFARLHAIGGEDHLMKEILYNVGGACCAILKNPFTFTYSPYISLYNDTASDQTVWAEGEYYLI